MCKIQYVSRFFKWVFQLTFILLPILLVIYWINAPSPILAKGISISYIPELPTNIELLDSFPLHTKLLGFTVSLIPLCVNLFVLFFLIRLFKRFEQLEFFSINSVRNIKYIGYTLFIGQILSPIHQALISMAVTWHNSPGDRVISIAFSQVNLGILLTALLIILVSWIRSEGYTINEGLKHTI